MSFSQVELELAKAFCSVIFLRIVLSRVFPSLPVPERRLCSSEVVLFIVFFGLGIMEGGVETTIDKAIKNRRVVRRLQKIEGFILDVVSMISVPALRAAECICRLSRDSDEPWGGARVIAVGDFAQLPPVVSGRDKERQWAFQDITWQMSEFKTVELKTILRSQDREYLQVLKKVRHGQVDQEVTDFLNDRVGHSEEFSGTRLFPHRASTDQFNLIKLQEIESKVHIFETTYHGDKKKIEQLKKFSPIAQQIHLKKEALIMLRQNDPKQRWVNGSLGYVKEFLDDALLIKLFNGKLIELEPASFSLQDADGQVVAVAENYPVSLAYASTIHKAQGATFDQLMVDLRKLWEPGQAYVALSRVTHSDNLYIEGWTPDSIRVAPEVVRFYHSL